MALLVVLLRTLQRVCPTARNRVEGGGGLEGFFERLVSREDDEYIPSTRPSLIESWGGCCHHKYKLPRLTGPQDRVEK